MSVILEWRKLITTCLVDDGTLEAQLDNLWEIRSRCSLNGIIIEDYVFAGTILTQLPESYWHISDTLLAIKEVKKLTPEEVRSKILETEIRRKDTASPYANALRSHTSSANKKIPKGYCYKCGKKGHWADRCRDDSPASDAVPPPFEHHKRTEAKCNVNPGSYRYLRRTIFLIPG